MISKDIPIPDTFDRGEVGRRGRRPKYPFATMQIGDSFLAEGDARDTKWRAADAAYKIGRKLGRQFTARKEGQNVRIWRVE